MSNILVIFSFIFILLFPSCIRDSIIYPEDEVEMFSSYIYLDYVADSLTINKDAEIPNKDLDISLFDVYDRLNDQLKDLRVKDIIIPSDIEELDIKICYYSDLWICHHPGTRFHNKICVNEEYPDGCYVQGDVSKFCWELTLEDCIGNIDPWFEPHCKLLVKDCE